MTTSVILVRHGQTAWNAAEVFRGQIDIELDETGLKQAELLAEYLSHRKLAAVYSSPLKRAVQTAEAIARHHRLIVEIAPGLNDMDFGEWQGLSLQEVRTRSSELFEIWVSDPRQVRIPSGESLHDVHQRALALVNQVVKKHEDKAVALVSHRVVNKVLICALLGLDDSHFWNVRLDTCGMTTFEFDDGQFVLTEHNNTSFLEPLRQDRLRDF
ncbi:MAG TPA: histidine phosphatase family protein [Dehalococcoidia bacterium]|nr:histidine phosphatase family protein [Dehalococcoidia bacterium]